VPAAAVSRGDLLTVLPGDRIPVDGSVTRGRSSINEAALTGEPLPVPKIAGTLVRGAMLLCMVPGCFDAITLVASLPAVAAASHVLRCLAKL
jgi:magnesium-transporting ATPase (P-type)